MYRSGKSPLLSRCVQKHLFEGEFATEPLPAGGYASFVGRILVLPCATSPLDLLLLPIRHILADVGVRLGEFPKQHLGLEKELGVLGQKIEVRDLALGIVPKWC